MQKEFGYARVSTAHQREDRQIQRLLEYGVEERNIMIDKQSGKDFDRIGYISLKQNMLRSGDTLVITELDRLGRNKAMIKSELEWFKSEGIRVKILNVPTTLLDCGGQDWVLDMVSNILIEVMASVAVAKAKGVRFGRPSIAKPDNYEQVMALVDSGQLKAVDAMRELRVRKTTYYKLRQTYWRAAD